MPKIFPVSLLLVAPIILVGCGTIGRSIADALERNNFFYLDSNNVTIKRESADVGDTGTINDVTYTKRSRDMMTPSNAATTCTSGITDLSSLFMNEWTFNENIGHWNTSSVTTLYRTFFGADAFN